MAFAACAGDPSLVAVHRRGALLVATAGDTLVCEEDPSRALAAFAAISDARCAEDGGEGPFAFGWLAYDALRGDDPSSRRDLRPPGDRAPLALVRELRSWVALARDGSVIDGGGPERAAIEARVAEASTLEPVIAHEIKSLTDRARHRAQLSAVREAILDGEVYLVNVARVLHGPSGMSDAQLCARAARSQAPYAALLRGAGCVVAGMSMELGLSFDRRTRALCTRPIKGTRPRDPRPEHDRALALELAASDKERAENVMAVDVHRNDLGRVAEVGSVVVDALCAVEAHAFVHHLVSTVRARARPDVDARAVLEAMLPLGSVTGAPKRAAMQQIAAVEPERRGLYTGVYGAMDRDGSLELAVAIRTIVVDEAGAHYGSGGGIVIDSDPEREWDELSWKERAFAGASASTSGG